MPCIYCGQYGTNHPRWPLYIPPKATHYCSICGEGIYDGEEYIVNDDGEYAHWDCVDYGRDLAKFLGYKVREMNEEEWNRREKDWRIGGMVC